MPSSAADPSLWRKPAQTLQKEALIGILRTADLIERRLDAVLAPHRLSATQYNVLRILRGAGPEGLTCGEAAARMITRDPDITRLLDRLEARGLVSRERAKSDRRSIVTRLTGQGLRLLADLDDPIADLDRRQLGAFGEAELWRLVRILERIRESGA